MDLTFLMPRQGLEVWWTAAHGDDAVLCQLEATQDGILSAWVYGDSLSDDLPTPCERVSIRIPSARGLLVMSGLVLPDGLDGLTRIALNGTLRQLKSRLFSRVPMHHRPATAQLLDAEGQPAQPFEVRLVDLSGGGVRFETFEALAGDDRLIVMLELPDGSVVSPEVEIRSREPLHTVCHPAGLRGIYVNYAVHGSFPTISEHERHRLIRFAAQRREALIHRGIDSKAG